MRTEALKSQGFVGFERIVAGTVMLGLLAWLGAGCAPWPEQSDWQWRQWNPHYRLPYPGDQGAR
ncbi:MAG TPA: hypothetical protein P5233_10610 [Candidatus Paceibacterota bacterium]|nr:hypothetical protein [Candidatus Paceibacterota bacterium]